MPAKLPSLTDRSQKKLRALGRLLRDHRKQQRISATATAEAAGLSRVTLYRIEQGEASVTMGAYFSVILALGLTLELNDPKNPTLGQRTSSRKTPSKIRIADYKQLKRLAWQLKDVQEINPKEALALYERNWRHIDIKGMDREEREFLKNLLAAFKRERLLV